MGVPAEPDTEIVTSKLLAVVMLEADGVTLTDGATGLCCPPLPELAPLQPFRKTENVYRMKANPSEIDFPT